MNELSPEAKVLFRVAQDAFSPSVSRLMATYTALEARASVHTSEAPAASGNAALNPAGWSVWRLIGLGVLVTLGTGSAVLGARYFSEANNRSSESTTTDSIARPFKSEPDVPQEPVISSEKLPSVLRSSAPLKDKTTSASTKGDKVIGLSKAREAHRDSHQSRKPSERLAPPSVSNEIDDSLSREIALLTAARAALDRRDAAEALVLLDRHRTLYPLGTLKQEQLVTRVLALCLLGRTSDARAVARELKRAAPRSPHLARIRSSCAGELGPEIK
jgi:hypothetical protein